MPFIGTEFPERTRKGSTKYAKQLELMIKKPEQVYEFEGEFDVPATVVAQLRTNKFVAELAEENKGRFIFSSASGKVYGKFTKKKESNSKSKNKKRK